MFDYTDQGHQTGGVIRPAGLTRLVKVTRLGLRAGVTKLAKVTRLTGVTRPNSPICIEYKIDGEITVDHEKFPISSFDRSVSG